MFSSYLQYRRGRQAELQQLLTTAAEAGAPLAPALRAYLRDRPRGPAREMWVAGLLFFVVPGYYWIWHRRNNFDQKVARVIGWLEQGFSLHDSLEAVPGVVPGELLLTVKIGESTGQLARCLRSTATERLMGVWLEIMPRLLYPVAMLVFISLVTGFWMIFLLPKMEKIYHDFGRPLPQATKLIAGFGAAISRYLVLVLLAFFGLIQLATLNWSAAFRWNAPLLGRLYRMHVQSRVLRMLGVLLAAGKTIPDSLALLAKSPAFSPHAQRRLDAARQSVEQGRPLALSLQEAQLLQPAMAPLVQAAERAHHLPWALAELGESLLSRLMRLLRRGTMVLFPASVLLIGAFVAFVVLGMFMPVINLLAGVGK
jgi:type II secretory pathway component PulF